MAPCPNGPLRWRLLIPGKMLKVIKVLRLNEASTILPSHKPGNIPDTPRLNSADIDLKAHLRNLIWTGTQIRPWTKKLRYRPR